MPSVVLARVCTCNTAQLHPARTENTTALKQYNTPREYTSLKRVGPQTSLT